MKELTTMKVMCITNNRFSKDELTIGKIYEIIKYEGLYYFIADDSSELIYFDNDKDFISLEQYREQQLNKIGI